MSIEPTCDFCGLIDKNRCKNLTSALKCNDYKTNIPENIDSTKTDDFGFSFESESNIFENVAKVATQKTDSKIKESQSQLKKLKKENDILKQKLKQVYTMVDALLVNLARNPEKEIIKWPNRVEKINEFRQKLDNIINEEV